MIYAHSIAENNHTTHLGFSDESNFRNRYPAVGLITGECSVLSRLETLLDNTLKESYHHTMSWHRMDRIRARNMKPMLDTTADFLKHNNVRIDILTWDTRDKHFGRFIKRNVDLPEMYLTLFEWITKYGWPDNSVWGIYPDRFDGIDWSKIQQILHNVNFINERNTRDSRLLQLVDFFIGITTFICNDIKGYVDYDTSKHMNSKNELNIRAKLRYDLVDYFMDISEKYDWNIQITDQGMRSYIESFDNQINIWTYNNLIRSNELSPLRYYKSNSHTGVLNA